MIFHLRRINELALNIKSLNFHPYVYTYDFKSIGFPAGIFYPDITLIPFALLRLLTGNFIITALVGVGIYTFATLVVVHWVVYKVTQNNLWAFFTAVIYAFSTYRIVDIWTRFALGEFIALTFIPLIIYGLYAIIVGNYNDWPFLAFGMALTMLTHVLSTYIDILFCLIIGMLSIKNILNNNFIGRVFSLLKAVVTSFCASAIFILPFVEQEYTGIFSQPAPMKVSFYASPLFNVVKSMLNNNLFGNYNWGGDEAFTVGFIGLVVLVVGGIVFSHFSKLERIIYFICIVLVIFPTTLLPWTLFNHVSLINVIQFPFRELGIASFLLSFLGGKEVIFVVNHFEKYGEYLTVIFVLLLIICPWYSSVTTLRATNQLMNNCAIIESMKGNEYSTLNLDNYIPTRGLSTLNDVSNDHLGKINNHNYYFKNYVSSPNLITYRGLMIKKDDKVELPFYNIKNIQVIIAGKRQAVGTDNNGHVTFKPDRDTNRVEVKYIPSILDRLGELITVITWGSLIIVPLFKGKSRN